MNIGFVGIGIMGAPMVAHLVAGGHHLFLHDLDASKVEACINSLQREQPGTVRACGTPREVAQLSDLVFTMLPNGQVVQSVVAGADGLLEGFRRGALLIDTSSSEPWLTLQTGKMLGEKGVAMIDAPVSGAQWGAQQAQLVFMVGAHEQDLDRVRPVLALLGDKIYHLGGPGSGHAMKCINNTITAMTLAATSEGMLIGKQYGLDPTAMIDVLNQSTGMSWISQTHFKQRVINRAFDDPFKLALMLKDIGIAMDLGRASTDPVKLPMFTLGQQLWAAAAEAAGPQASVSEFVRWTENQSALRIEP